MTDFALEHSMWKAVENANKIVITAHKSPDGDSIGSSLALFHFLKNRNKQVNVVHPDPAPEFLKWVAAIDSVIDMESNPRIAAELLANADLIFCLDYNEPSRVGDQMMPLLQNSRAVKIMIDHHLNPADFCNYTFSLTAACSTCELIYQWIKNIDRLNEITIETGTCLYLGIMTDTGSFRFPSVSTFTHEIAADLIQRGVKHHLIHEQVYDTNTIDRIKLRGYALSEKLVCMEGLPIAYVALTQEELIRFNYQKGDTEGLVNQVLGVQGINMAVLFMEKDGLIKISFRAKGDFTVNALATKYFDGGGHAYASGGVSTESMEATIEKFVTIVKEFVPYKHEK